MNRSALSACVVSLALILTATDISAARTLPAFPGAEGGGALSSGGRGGAVLIVTSLYDAGPGSLRAAVETSGPRTVVFAVGGTIILESALRITNPFITVAGQTAPGDGIQIRTRSDQGLLRIQTHDVVWRYTRLRHGFTSEKSNADNISIENGAYNVVLDHNSIMWSTDENVGIWSGGRRATTVLPPHRISVQWNLLAEPLRAHPTQVLTGASSSADADLMTDLDYHRNFMANSGWRNPLLKNKRSRFVSNLMYNASRYYMQMAGGAETDAISNHYVQKTPNPAAGVHEFDAIPVTEDPRYPTGTASIYLAGNVGPNNPTGTLDNWESMARAIRHENAESRGTGESALDARYKRAQPLAPAGVPILPLSALPPGRLAEALLPEVGCSRRLDADGKWVSIRDAVDARVIAEFRGQTSGIVPVKETDVGGYPIIKGGEAYPDTNRNGMSDRWESAHRVNDPSADGDGDGYTNLEEFLNATNPTQPERR